MNEVHIVATTLSVDFETSYDVLATIGASAALTISNIPFGGPIGSVRVGRIDGQLVINPSRSRSSRTSRTWTSSSPAPRTPSSWSRPAPKQVTEASSSRRSRSRTRRSRRSSPCSSNCRSWSASPSGRSPRGRSTRASSQRSRSGFGAAIDARHPGPRQEGAHGRDRRGPEGGVRAARRRRPPMPSAPCRSSARSPSWRRTSSGERIAVEKRRPDGRATDEIRPITCEVGVVPRTHGSALFTRGETQAMSLLTLGGTGEYQRIDGIGIEDKKRYIHHYNFPPFSVGETGFMRGPKRRDIGHGALAERALLPVIPSEVDFPYTIRIVSRDPREQRLVLHGERLRLDPVAHGRRRADQGPGGRHRDGPHQGGRRLRRAHRHRRRRGPPRRHGLQGRRHRRGHHRPADGHQDHAASPSRSSPRPSSRRARRACSSSAR